MSQKTVVYCDAPGCEKVADWHIVSVHAVRAIQEQGVPSSYQSSMGLSYSPERPLTDYCATHALEKVMGGTK